MQFVYRRIIVFFLPLIVISMGAAAETQLAEGKEWEQETKPKLNFVELDGYFRLRFNLMNGCDLSTFIPPGLIPSAPLGRGTSMCPPPESYLAYNDNNVPSSARSHVLFSGNMRLRVDPTLNISEDIRIKATLDVFDNLVLGSTPAYLAGNDRFSPTYPLAFLSNTELPPLVGINNPYGSLLVKRLWGEVSTPVGELRFGRMPLHFGLGILFNGGNQITDDYTDNIDGILFASRVLGHYVIPAFSIGYVGDVARGGGLGSGGDNGQPYLAVEDGQRYDLDPSDNVYSFYLTIAKKDKEKDIKALLAHGNTVVNYGVMGSYRFQLKDKFQTKVANNDYRIGKVLNDRNAQAGYGSLWGSVQWDKLHIEAELAGIFGFIGNAQDQVWDEQAWAPIDQQIWLVQGGAAIKSRYGFLQNRLEVGLDLGWASGDTAPGFGIRPGINKSPNYGDADGQQFGRAGDNLITNFRFNPNYQVDLLLFREILGTISDAFYFRPHVGYMFTDHLGVRGEIISSFTNFAGSTTGNSNVLGLEFDATVFYQSEDGLYLMAQYGLLVPFDGLSHLQDPSGSFPGIGARAFQGFGTARNVYTFQFFGGIAF